MQWVIDWISWLMSLAKPANLSAMLSLGGPVWVGYLILATIIFAETGLLIGFFLPGDSLLFSAGFLASTGELNILVLITLLSAAAILGDAVNYYLGLQMGEHVFEKGRLRFVKHSHLMAAKAFYEKHGGKAIVLARFVPLVRTFTPFVAGVARMRYRDFVFYNILGGLGWVISMSAAGYWLGRIPFVQRHFEKVVVLIILISVLPIAIEVIKHWWTGRTTPDSLVASVVPATEDAQD
jgi:membrane-associated protein